MKLKLLAGAAMVGMFAAGAAYAAPADSGWYGAVDLGAHIPGHMETTSEFTELGGPPASLRYTTNQPDFAGFARIGYKINPHVRVELEGGYRNGGLVSVIEQNSGRPVGSITAICNFSNTVSCARPHGSIDTWTIMGNVLVDLLPNGPVDPFIGAGVGDAHVRMIAEGRTQGVGAGTGFFSSDDTQDQFAFQGIAGLAFHVTDQLSVDFTYRWLGTSTMRFRTHQFNGFQLGTVNGSYDDNSFTLGLRYLLAAPPP
ncbi:MAG: outer membrane protein, partial [Bradyrhizobium sp.]